MPRRKISMGLIPNRRQRVNTFAKRKEGLTKKAGELATLCGVRVALVCGFADGAGAADVWESEPGVLNAYRDLPPEERAKHTHRAYAEAELRKAEVKLVRVRQEGPAALAPGDAAVYALTMEDARRVLAAVDDALRAVNARRAALGLPLDDGGGGGIGIGLHRGSGVDAFAATGASDAAAVPRGIAAPAPSFAGSNLVGIDGYLLGAQGNNNANEQQVMWDGGFDPCSAAVNWHPAGYAIQPCTADIDGAYKLQHMAADMYGNNNNNSDSIGRLPWDAFHLPTNAVAGYGVEFTGAGNSYVGGMPSYLTPPVLSNADLPLRYPSLEMRVNYLDAPAAQQQGVGGLSLAGSNFNFIGTLDNFINAPQAQPLALSYHGGLVNANDYASQWPSAGQLWGAAGSDPGTSRSVA